MSKAMERVKLIHPEGKNAPSISIENYQLFEKAIIHVMSQATAPLTWTQIQKGVVQYLTENNIVFDGSPGWFAVSMKLHFEATGVIESYFEKGRKLHRLKGK